MEPWTTTMDYQEILWTLKLLRGVLLKWGCYLWGGCYHACCVRQGRKEN